MKLILSGLLVLIFSSSAAGQDFAGKSVEYFLAKSFVGLCAQTPPDFERISAYARVSKLKQVPKDVQKMTAPVDTSAVTNSWFIKLPKKKVGILASSHARAADGKIISTCTHSASDVKIDKIINHLEKIIKCRFTVFSIEMGQKSISCAKESFGEKLIVYILYLNEKNVSPITMAVAVTR
jgi:hypothetical protein